MPASRATAITQSLSLTRSVFLSPTADSGAVCLIRLDACLQRQLQLHLLVLQYSVGNASCQTDGERGASQRDQKRVDADSFFRRSELTTGQSIGWQTTLEN